MSSLFQGTKKLVPDLNELQLPNQQACFSVVFNFKQNSEQLELDMDIASFPVFLGTEDKVRHKVSANRSIPRREQSCKEQTTIHIIFLLCMCLFVRVCTSGLQLLITCRKYLVRIGSIKK